MSSDMDNFASKIDLSLGWTRVKRDFSDLRTFTEHPFELEIVESDIDQWLGSIRSRIEDSYNPGPSRLVGIPKPYGGIRPGANLVLSDQVVFAALLQVLRRQIQPALEWSSPSKDYAYRLKKEQSHAQWFESYFTRWKAFDHDSLARLNKEASTVVTADIAGYYEQIDLTTLNSDLRSLNVCPESLALLMKCLNRWARVQGRGIPQGFSASDILGKLYLNSVDQALADNGVDHVRWVDDFRLFCKSNSEAREQLALLIDLLSARGLVVQSAKTRIIPAIDAKVRFHQVHAVLEPIRKSFISQLVDSGILVGPSASAALVDELLSKVDADEPVEILKEAFDTHFVNSSDEFNKTLLRYLLKRLGSARDPHAYKESVTYLWRYPEESASVLRYISAIDEVLNAEVYWLNLISNRSIPYAYQIYQFLRWRFGEAVKPTDDYLRWVRLLASKPSQLSVVRSFARATLARWGTQADLANLQSSYADASSDLERAEIVRCLTGMEKGRRNAFLSRLAEDGQLTSMATKLTRQERLPWVAI
jgi:hypothetical protein